jgi:hypothetical protein
MRLSDKRLISLKSSKPNPHRTPARQVTLAVLIGLTSVPMTLALAQQTNLGTPAEPRAGGRAGAPDANSVVRSVQVSAKLPPYRFVLKPDVATNNSSLGSWHMGHIDIFKGNSKVVWQSIAVEGADPSQLVTSFHTLDINFDGYQDFAVVYEIAAKWGSYSYWLFDPGSGRFITNALTADLRKLGYDRLTLIPQRNEIRISLFIGICRNSFEVYRVQNGHLVLMESEIHSPRGPGRCLVETRKRVNGKLTLVETKETENEVQPP